MKELFSDPDSEMVNYCKSLLEDAGIPAEIREDPGSGDEEELADASTIYTLCVVNDEDRKSGLKLVIDHLEEDEEKAEEEIECSKCGESNPGNFDVCWSCGKTIAEGE